jgi:hypothetical protein
MRREHVIPTNGSVLMSYIANHCLIHCADAYAASGNPASTHHVPFSYKIYKMYSVAVIQTGMQRLTRHHISAIAN